MVGCAGEGSRGGAGRVSTTAPEYAIAGTWLEYHNWKRQHPELGIVSYLTKERAEILLAKGAPRGVLHRAPGWETSDARELAERLEG
jgi:hypothetical protein